MSIKRTLIGLALAAGCAAASAAAITPVFQTFGTLAGATFGGAGIPNHAVAIHGDAQSGLLMGLTAHQRFVGPNLANDGAGRFTASAGVSQDPPSPADPYARWNFAFYIGGADMSDMTFALLYDFDPAAGNDESTHGSSGAAGIFLPNPTQDSWNLGMDFLAAAVPGIAPPAHPTFDPDVPGEYSFALVAFGFDQGLLVEKARVAIVVDVVAAQVPLPGSLALVGAALLGLAGLRRRA